MGSTKPHVLNKPGRRKTAVPASTSFETAGNRQWDIYSSSKSNRVTSVSSAATKTPEREVPSTSPPPQPPPDYSQPKRQSRQKSPLSFFSQKLGGLSKHISNETGPSTPATIAVSAASKARERSDGAGKRRPMSSYDTTDGNDNRNPPRFEEDRQRRQRGQVRSRFFGQREEDDSEAMDPEADELRRMQRAPPDMRRLLLNNVNMTRSKSIGNDIDQKQPSVIRAI